MRRRASGGEHGGKAKLDGTRMEPSNPTPTLKELGINKKTSSFAQRISELPKESLASVIDRRKSVSAATKEHLAKESCLAAWLRDLKK
jgi:hypothetical protein